MSGLIELQKKCGVTADGVWGPATFKAACKKFGLTPEEGAHFFGQCFHETGGFTKFSENLNYSTEGLTKVFKKYFPTIESTVGYARNPQAIANKVYSNRMGNGDYNSGDGWKYRGRGAIQTTGKTNYSLFAASIGDPTITTNPDIVETKYAFESALFFFRSNNIFALCKTVDDASITKVRKKVNGGVIGLDDAIKQTKKFYSWK